MEPIDHTDELKDAPLLRSIPKHDPFIVPDGFFDHFPHAVQAMIVEQQRTIAKPWWSRLAIPTISFGLIALLVLVWWMIPTNQPELNTSVPELDEQTEFAVLDETDSDLLYALFDTSTTPMGNVDLQLETEELIAYLDNENLPLDFLIEQQ